MKTFKCALEGRCSRERNIKMSGIEETRCAYLILEEIEAENGFTFNVMQCSCTKREDR